MWVFLLNLGERKRDLINFQYLVEKKKDESGDKNQKKKLERQEEKLKINNRELSMVNDWVWLKVFLKIYIKRLKWSQWWQLVLHLWLF